MAYKKLWTDMHSNLHHERITDLPKWYDHIKQLMDFWPFAYYPFYMKKSEWGLGVEDRYDDEIIAKDWEYIREFTKQVNADGYPMFMGYEWQGCGFDGDHNVFFLDNEQNSAHPMRYVDLVSNYTGVSAIGIPHHLAYQLGSRGKNWETHNEEFSPFAEIYSSHGCSENDEGPLDMNRHIHMGPRTGVTSYEQGLNKGYHVGVIAAGDNHSVPGVFEHGSLCVLAKDSSKESIWDAFKNRRTYGVTKSRIGVDFSINDECMGSIVHTDKEATLKFHIEGTNAIDRIEILKDNIVDEMVVHSGKWERLPYEENVRFKFKIEFGWGPDTRVYHDIYKKCWNGSLVVDGTLVGVEKCWNNFGQELRILDEKSCEFDLTTYKSTATGKWMGPSNVTTEGFIFEIEAPLSSNVTLMVDGKEYCLAVEDLLACSRVVELREEIEQLTKETWGDVTHYRDDPWWHNAYKFKVHKAAPVSAYSVDFEKTMEIEKNCNVRLRVLQKDGDAAWSSPIFIKKD